MHGDGCDHSRPCDSHFALENTGKISGRQFARVVLPRRVKHGVDGSPEDARVLLTAFNCWQPKRSKLWLKKMTLCVKLLTPSGLGICRAHSIGDTVVPVFSSTVWAHDTHGRTIVPSDVPGTALSVTGRACRREHESSCCSCRSSTPGRLVAKRLSPSAVDRQPFHPRQLRASCAFDTRG